MYVYTTTTKIVFLVIIEHFSLFCRLSFLYDFKGVFDMVEKKTDRRILFQPHEPLLCYVASGD